MTSDRWFEAALVAGAVCYFVYQYFDGSVCSVSDNRGFTSWYAPMRYWVKNGYYGKVFEVPVRAYLTQT